MRIYCYNLFFVCLFEIDLPKNLENKFSNRHLPIKIGIDNYLMVKISKQLEKTKREKTIRNPLMLVSRVRS